MAKTLMNHLIARVVFVLCMLTLSVVAEESEQPIVDATMLLQPELGFISDQFYVPLRSSPCSSCKIVHKGLKSGTQLSVLGHKDIWSLVTTNSGYRGWIRNQHISSEPIARSVLDANAKKIIQLKNENQRLEQDMQHSFELVQSLRQTINKLETDHKALSKELAALKLISSKEIALNDQNQVLVKHNHLLQEERDVLRADVNDLQSNKRNESFLYGGFVTFLGAILAALIPRLRGRKRLSEWR
jgi:SH3 domain protein